MKKKRLRTSGGNQLASVTSLIEFRAKLQGTASDSLQVIGASLGNDIGPLSNGCSADIESARNVDRLFEVSEDVFFEHTSMLTIVSTLNQPYLSNTELTLVDMKNWKDCKTLGERLKWSMDKSGVSTAQLAETCGISRVAVGKWLSDDIKDIKLPNFFAAAQLCVVNDRWLALGDGAPDRGIPSIYTDISGPDLNIARQLTALADKNLRKTIKSMLEHTRPAATATNQKKRSG